MHQWWRNPYGAYHYLHTLQYVRRLAITTRASTMASHIIIWCFSGQLLEDPCYGFLPSSSRKIHAPCLASSSKYTIMLNIQIYTTVLQTSCFKIGLSYNYGILIGSLVRSEYRRPLLCATPPRDEDPIQNDTRLCGRFYWHRFLVREPCIACIRSASGKVHILRLYLSK